MKIKVDSEINRLYNTCNVKDNVNHLRTQILMTFTTTSFKHINVQGYQFGTMPACWSINSNDRQVESARGVQS